jgi:hypothetical protein
MFARNSDYTKLAAAFRSENVDLAAVDAGDGKKAMASVLFPNDPSADLRSGGGTRQITAVLI